MMPLAVAFPQQQGFFNLYDYGEKVITPMIEEGLNPGLMIYQPYK